MNEEAAFLKIKVNIADRLYPLTIKPQQEEGLRKAAKKIEELCKKFEEAYEVKDKQDVLAMCALQFATEAQQKSIKEESENQDVEVKLKSWLNKMEQAI